MFNRDPRSTKFGEIPEQDILDLVLELKNSLRYMLSDYGERLDDETRKSYYDNLHNAENFLESIEE